VGMKTTWEYFKALPEWEIIPRSFQSN